MDRAFKDIEKKNLLASKFFTAIFSLLTKKEQKTIENLTNDELISIVKFIFNSLSVQKDPIIY